MARVAALVLPAVAMLVVADTLVAEGALSASDHPYRFTQLVWARQAIAAGHNPLGWNPDAWGGYAELQFYPPGFALLGAAIGIVTDWSDESAYRALTLLVYVLPAVSSALCLLTLRARPLVAGLGGVVAGAAAFGVSGTTVGTGLGTVASRLSLGLAPLAVAAFVQLVRQDGRRGRFVWSAVAAGCTAAVLVAHPYHFGPMLLVAGAATYDRARREAWLRAGAVAVAGFLVAGFWWFGQLAFRELSVPFLWADLDLDTVVHPVYSSNWDWWLLCGAAVAGVAVSWPRRAEQPFTLYRGLPLLAGLVLTVEVVLVQAAGVSLLDPYRLVDDIFFWVAICSVLVVEAVLDLPAVRAAGRRWPAVVASLVVVALAVGWIDVQSRNADTDALFAPRLAEFATIGLTGLADDLRGDEGRVLFPNSTAFGGATHAYGYVALLAGREYLGGTSTHPSPLQPILMYGPGHDEVRDLANDFDDRSVFGLPWEAIRDDDAQAERFAGYLRQLGVTEVAFESDPASPSLPARALAEHPDLFRLEYAEPWFAVYGLRDAAPGRIGVVGGDAQVVESSADDVRARAVIAADGQADVRVRVLDGPFWKVTLDGAPAATTTDELGQPRLEVPAGEHVVEVRLETPMTLRVGRVLLPLLGMGLVVLAALGPLPAVVRRWTRV
ncbi:MAG: hypothetical protein MUF83_13630 [Acidimicrobiales bacterium]|nr:hypothetical protein [Acidimicrobiales bacterium]